MSAASPQSAPLVSVVMTVHNNAPYLPEALASIRAQTLADWEMCVSDDGSTDGSGDILLQFARDNPGRVTVIQKGKRGLVPSVNDALAHARGEFIARMDGDDIALPDRFERQVAFLRANPDVVIVGAQVQLIDPFGVPLERAAHATDHAGIDRELMLGRGWGIVQPVSMIRRSAIETVGPYKEEYDTVEDLDLFLRLAEVGRVANLPDVLLKYRKHPTSVNARRAAHQKVVGKQVLEDACRRRGLPMPTGDALRDDVKRPESLAEQHRRWGWHALKHGHVSAARKHARLAVKAQPTSLAMWKLVYCAWRGR
jgi:glycosyltransferase involved in cell wall biosynthesis